MTELTNTESTEHQAPPIPATELVFTDLVKHQRILDAIKRLGFTTPTPVQAAVIPVAQEGGDVVAQAKTGSGKTLAYCIPLLQKLFTEEERGTVNGTFALVLVPTRELASQVNAVAQSVSSDVHPALLIGGADMDKQISALKKDCRIVVGTPGRVMDLIQRKILKLNNCRFFALDEADEMLSMGFLEDVRAILSRLPDKRQGIFVSATITPRVEMIAHSFLSKPTQISIQSAAEEMPPVEHFYCEVGNDLMAKPQALCDIIEAWRPASAIIFCNTKSDTQMVEVLLRRRGFDARRINSDLSQRQRDKIMKKIRANELQFLVATDVAARGLDIEQIDLVVNYAIHEQPELYVHRTGRTGRAGRTGKAISLVGPRDFGSFHFLQKVVKAEFKKIDVPTESDVSDARLAHLYEILREGSFDVKPRDVVVAQKLLKEMGGIESADEDLLAMVAKLIRYSVEHYLQGEAKSLDEEDELEESDAPQERRPERSSQGRDDGRGERRDERRPERRDDGRGERREGRRDDQRREPRGERREDQRNERPRESRQEARQEERRPPRERGEAPRERRESDRDSDRGPREQLALIDRTNRSDELRLYIGQGAIHGMTSDLFVQLAKDFGNIDAADLKRLNIRQRHGFVDLMQPQAKQLVANLNGIEYNGTVLPVEFATVIQSGERQSRDRNRGGRGDDRRGNRSGGNRRDDDRRGGPRRHSRDH